MSTDSNKEIEIKYQDVDDLIPYANNPRLNDAAIDVVANSINEFGFKNPIVVDKHNVIVAGHTRLLAAQELGLRRVPTVIADDLSSDQVNAFRLVDNKTSEFAEWDMNALGKELAELEQVFGAETMASLGFELERIDPDDFGTDFELPEGEQGDMRTMTFQVHVEQKNLIEFALESVKGDIDETFGNTNKNGNALYEVAKQWQAQRT